MKFETAPRLALVCLALLGALVLASPALAREPREISRSELLASQESGEALFLIDVRTPAEFAEGRVPGAVNIPRDQLPQHFSRLAAARDRLVVYCERGPRALAAASTLLAAGFGEVRHLSGDMAGWRAAGLPIEK